MTTTQSSIYSTAMNSTISSTGEISARINGIGYFIGISVGLVVLIGTIAFASYFCKHVLSSPSPPRHNNGSQVGMSVVVEVGLDETTLKGYPTLVYSQDKVETSCCPICLADYKDGKTLRRLPDCGHLFHVKCVDPWLRLRPTCPVCRNSPLPTPLPTPLAEVVPLAHQQTFTNNTDSIEWTMDGRVQPFTVRKQSAILQRQRTFAQSWNIPVARVWVGSVPPKVNYLVWSAFIGRLPTTDRLLRMGMNVDGSCKLCGSENESITHLFLTCGYSHSVWTIVRRDFDCKAWNMNSITDAVRSWDLFSASPLGKLVWQCLFHVVCWHLWLERNTRTFGRTGRPPDGLASDTRKTLWRWLSRKAEFKGVSYDIFGFNWGPLVIM